MFSEAISSIWSCWRFSSLCSTAARSGSDAPTPWRKNSSVLGWAWTCRVKGGAFRLAFETGFQVVGGGGERCLPLSGPASNGGGNDAQTVALEAQPRCRRPPAPRASVQRDQGGHDERRI